MRISDWSSDVCSSDLLVPTILALAGVSDAERRERHPALVGHDLSAAIATPTVRTGRDAAGILFNYAVRYGWNAPDVAPGVTEAKQIGRASWRERVCQYVEISGVAGSLTKKNKS